MLLIDTETANSILESSENLVNKITTKDSLVSVKTIEKGGRKEGGKNLTDVERITIGAVVSSGLMTEREAAREFNVDKSHAHRLRHGVVTPGYNHIDIKTESDKIQEKIKPIQDKAIDKLMESLGLMTSEKLEKCGAKDLSTIASNVSKVISNTMPKEVNVDGRTQIIMYTPNQKRMDEFDVVEI